MCIVKQGGEYFEVRAMDLWCIVGVEARSEACEISLGVYVEEGKRPTGLLGRVCITFLPKPK